MELLVAELVDKLAGFYRTRKFIGELATAHHRFCLHCPSIYTEFFQVIYIHFLFPLCV